MPIFEYACPHCGHIFEKLVWSSDHNLPACPKCGWKRVKQMFSAFATGGAPSRSASSVCAPSGGG